MKSRLLIASLVLAIAGLSVVEDAYAGRSSSKSNSNSNSRSKPSNGGSKGGGSSNGSNGNGSNGSYSRSSLGVRGKTYNVTTYDTTNNITLPSDVFVFHTDGSLNNTDSGNPASGFYTANLQKFTAFLTGPNGTAGFSGISDIKGTQFTATGTATASDGSTFNFIMVGYQQVVY